jgi:uncharacterized membrane protein YfcA
MCRRSLKKNDAVHMSEQHHMIIDILHVVLLIKIKNMTKLLKYTFVIVVVVTLFFIDYSVLDYSNNFKQYTILLGSIVGFFTMFFVEKYPLKRNIRRIIAKIVIACALIGALLGLLQLFYFDIPLKKVIFSLLSACLICIGMVYTLYYDKPK